METLEMYLSDYKLWVAVGGVVLVLLIKCAYVLQTKCPYCKSKKITVTSKKELYSEPVMFKENVRIKEYDNKDKYYTEMGFRTLTNTKRPDKVMTQEVYVQGTRVWYEVKYKCLECQKEFLKKEYIDKKPIMK